MRKILIFLFSILLILGMASGVSAANSVTSAQTVASVSADGSCSVSMTITIHLDSAVGSIHFPIPENSSGINLNGSAARTSVSSGVRWINLSGIAGNMTGDFSFHIQYSLSDVITVADSGSQQLQLPLLSGFGYTIETMQFTVTLPGTIEAKPAFTSGYHQSSIEAELNCTVDGMTIHGNSLKSLKDHETLTLLLDVSDEMFPRDPAPAGTPTGAARAIMLCCVIAVVYWLVLLRYLPLRVTSTTTAPEGYSAGVLGCAAGLQGVDLSMTVLTWAQLGYLTIRRGKQGHVILCKRMDMGNERGEFERRTFQKLFAKQEEVDTTSLRYARLHNELAQHCTQVTELVASHRLALRLFRVFPCLIGAFAGAGIGLALSMGAVLKGFFVILLGTAGGFSGWYMQAWAGSLLLHRKPTLLRSAYICGFWVLISMLADVLFLGGWLIFGLGLTGLMLRTGGRRTPLGKQTAAEIRGLRRYLSRVDTKTLRQRLENEPDYFFNMLPWAMALGVDKRFSKRFGKIRIQNCPYIGGGQNKSTDALQWCDYVRKTVAAMEDRANHLPIENLTKKIRTLLGQ